MHSALAPSAGILVLQGGEEVNTAPHLDAPDDFYEALIEAHRGLTAAQSHALNARLVLLLANHVGALDVLREALDAARGATRGEAAAAIG